MPHGRPAKRRRLSPEPVDDDRQSETIKSTDIFKRAADWDLEQNYEQRSRSKKVKESNKLPTKNVEGQLTRVARAEESDDDSDSFLGSSSEEAEDKDNETPPTEDTEAVPAIPLKQQLIQTQEEIARLAALVNEDPEEHAGSFKKLSNLVDSKAHPSLQKLVLLSQAAIYKDAVPGYRIREYGEEELSNKVSKDVRKTRQYEQALVTSYGAYVKRLIGICNNKNKSEDAIKPTALNCVCTLLLSIPHFNHRNDLLSVLVRELRSKLPSAYFNKSLTTLETFFDQDEDGAPSLKAVELLYDMIKKRGYDVREEVLNSFFHLRLLTELSKRSSTTQTDRPDDLSKLHGRKAKKEKKEHKSKKERKIAKERRAVEKDMREADAAVDYEARDKMQSETLKVVFLVYFNTLKARIPHLMGAVLEGLAKFAHLINQDFFGDILEVLKDLISQAEELADGEDPEDDGDDNRDRIREGLLSTQTAFTLLSQQDAAKSASALHLDLSFFSSHIYKSLYQVGVDPDIELGPKSVHLPDPNTNQPSKRDFKVNVSTPVLLLTRTLTAILLTPSQYPTSQTVATFYKRLLSCTLQMPEKSTIALLALMEKILDRHGRKVEPLWYTDERKGDGVFKPEANTVEGSNVFAMGSGVWEAELLKKHYCPQVSEKVKKLDKMISGLHKQ